MQRMLLARGRNPCMPSPLIRTYHSRILNPSTDLRPLIHDVIPAWRLEKRSTQPRGREPQARGVSAGALDFWFI